MPRDTPARRPRIGGLSLVELLVSMAAVTAVVAVAAPTMRDLMESHHALTAEHALIAHLSLTRATAVTRRKDAVLCPSSNGLTCTQKSDWTGGWLLFLDADGNRRPDTRDDVIRSDPAPTSTRLLLVGTPGRHMARYLPDGRSAGANLTIFICSQQRQLLAAVILNNMGRVRSERPSINTACRT